MTESQERFLRAIAARLPAERVVEVHLFPPIRNGAQETGIAIVSVALEEAAVSSPSDVLPDARLDAPPAAPPDALTAASPDAMPDVAPPVEASGEACDPTEDAAGGPPPLGNSHESSPDASSIEGEPAPATTASGDAHPDDGSVVAALARELPEPSEPIDAADAPAPAPGPRRHTVYTARYRYTIKGPDRGKFEVDVQAEADAPLVTIDLVVRGVQQRANEDAEPERLPGERLREIAAKAPGSGAPGAPGASGASGAPGRAA